MSKKISHCFEDFREGFRGLEAGDLENCCGADMGKMADVMKGCPCASLIKNPKKALFVGLTVGGLIFSLTAAGWVLGILAFFRTF